MPALQMSSSILPYLSLRPALHASSLQRIVILSQKTTLRRASTQSKPQPPSSPSTKPVADPLLNPKPKADPLEPANSKDAASHVLKPLARPIGLTTIPQPGQNTGIDTRPFQQRRDELFNYDRHLERRKELTRKIARPYFRDWSRLQFNRGKIFLAPVRLIRADKALYFPNLRGVTLAQPKVERDTTAVARGCITLVRVFTGRWAEVQVDTWLQDETLKKMFQAGESVLQRIDLNVEQNRMKSWVVRMFMPGLRRSLPQEMHSRYFLVRRGFEEEYKHALGMYNAQVGHVYLLDDMCRIRWGGSGDASEEEKASLRKGIVRLAQELKERQEQNDGSTLSASRQKVAGFVARIPSILT